MSNRVAGIVYVKVDGQQLQVSGNISYNLGLPKREAKVGHDGVHGYKELPQVAYIEGEITDKKDLDLKKFCSIDGSTVTAQLANGKTIVLRDAWYAGEGKGESEDAKIEFRFESKFQAQEVR